jgi:phosphoglycerate dehydrogenase-like enzyme
MSEKIDVLMTMLFSDELMKQLESISPRLVFHPYKANRVEDIPPDSWATAQVLYTGRVLPAPELAPNLRWVQFHLAGIDHAKDAPILHRDGVITTTVSGISASQVGEYILMMLLALGHHLPDLIEYQRKSTWPKDRYERFAPRELRGSTVGIVGYGSIGRQVARLLHDFGAKVLAAKLDGKNPKDLGYTIEGQGDPEGDYVHRIYPVEALRSMAKSCDYLVVTTPLTAKTRNLVNDEVFQVMKETACIVDASRGGVINQADLINALRERKLGGAALDVFTEEPLLPDNPLWKFPNVLISPHIAGNSIHYDERAVELFTVNLRRYLEGEPLLNVVDWEKGY